MVIIRKNHPLHIVISIKYVVDIVLTLPHCTVVNKYKTQNNNIAKWKRTICVQIVPNYLVSYAIITAVLEL